MAFDIFLKIDGIEGDSTDKAYEKQIEVLSYSTGLAQSIGGVASAQGARTGGRADFAPFAVVKRLDAASPKLASYCASGKSIPTIKLALCRATDEKTKFMEYTLSGVIVSSVNTSGSGSSEDPIPMEEVSFVYNKIQWAYTSTSADGVKGAEQQAGWDLTKNTKV
jgi:type VI secretion system secreted protein Hcp